MIDIEKIWTQEGIDEAMDHVRSASGKIEEAIEIARQQTEGAAKEIITIDSDILPRLLTEQFLNKKVSKTEVEKLKQVRERKAELQRIIEDHPFLYKGLQTELQKINSEGREITKKEHHVQLYEKLKKALKERHSPTLEQDLLDKARFLNCESDARNFLKNLREG